MDNAEETLVLNEKMVKHTKRFLHNVLDTRCKGALGTFASGICVPLFLGQSDRAKPYGIRIRFKKTPSGHVV